MRLLFYDDAAVFGGHEAMTLHAIEYLLEYTEETIFFVLSEANLRLWERLEQMRARFPRLTLHTTPVQTASFQGFRALFSPRQVAAVTRLLRSFAPDVVIVVQGGIEISSLGLLAARRARLPLLSYIPWGHSMRITGAALGRARDSVNRYFYKRPGAYITISDSMAASLRAQGVTAPIHVVFNCIDMHKRSKEERASVRARLDLPNDTWALGIVGRVHFKQKNHDFLLRSLSQDRERLGAWRLVVVGEGPDLPALQQLITSLDLGSHVTCLPWCQDISSLYSALDALVLPSRFEGVPLVMLEALAYELPVIASDRDGMKDLLPAEWLFPVGDTHALMDALARARQQIPSALTMRLKATVQSQCSPQATGAAFYRAIQAYHQSLSQQSAL